MCIPRTLGPSLSIKRQPFSRPGLESTKSARGSGMGVEGGECVNMAGAHVLCPLGCLSMVSHFRASQAAFQLPAAAYLPEGFL